MRLTGWHCERWRSDITSCALGGVVKSMVSGAWSALAPTACRLAIHRAQTDDWDDAYIGNGEAGGHAYVSRCVAEGLWPSFSGLAFELPNERRTDSLDNLALLDAFTVGAIAEAESRGLKVVAYNMAEANPPGEPEDITAAWAALTDSLKAIVAGGHYVGLHLYWKPRANIGPLDEWHGLDRRLKDLVAIQEALTDDEFENLQVVFNEVGIDDQLEGGSLGGWQKQPNYGLEAYAEDLLILEYAARALAQIKGIALFNIHGYDRWATYEHDEDDVAYIESQLGAWDEDGTGEEEPDDEQEPDGEETPDGDEVVPPGALTNAAFEGDWHQVSTSSKMPDGWTRFFETPPYCLYDDQEPHYGFEPEYGRGGAEETGPLRAISGYSLEWFNSYAAHKAGAWQQAGKTNAGADIEIGKRYIVGASMQSWHSQTDDPTISRDEDWIQQSYYAKKVGVDPAGGTDPWADTVLWSDPIWENDQWVYLTIEFEAEAEIVTVFVYGSPLYAFKHNNCYVDDVYLDSVSDGGDDDDGDELNQSLGDTGQSYIIPLNEDAALYKAAILVDEGAVAVSEEIYADGWVFQAFRFPGEPDVQHWFRCPEGDWGNVTHWERVN